MPASYVAFGKVGGERLRHGKESNYVYVIHVVLSISVRVLTYVSQDSSMYRY